MEFWKEFISFVIHDDLSAVAAVLVLMLIMIGINSGSRKRN